MSRKNCFCNPATLLGLLLIVFQFSKRQTNCCQAIDTDSNCCNSCCCNPCTPAPVVDNSILFIIALFYLCCCTNKCKC